MKATFVAAAAVASTALVLTSAAPALAAADTGANSRPSCIGLFSSADDIRAGVSRDVYAHELQAYAAASGTTPGAAMHELIGAPGAKC